MIAEAATLMSREIGVTATSNAVRAWLVSKRLSVIPAELPDFNLGLTFFRRFAEHRIGFADCLSFAIMVRLNVNTAFTFDRHFVYAAFDTTDWSRKP